MFLVLICKKCGHRVYVEAGPHESLFNKLASMPEYDCPNCGESGYENWLIGWTASQFNQ